MWQGRFRALGATSDANAKCSGLYSDVRGATECKTCAAMTYQEESGGQLCKACPDGTESEAGAVICRTWFLDYRICHRWLRQPCNEISNEAPLSSAVKLNLSSSIHNVNYSPRSSILLTIATEQRNRDININIGWA